jgi:tetratricopeptide (TPR) repeat protein
MNVPANSQFACTPPSIDTCAAVGARCAHPAGESDANSGVRAQSPATAAGTFLLRDRRTGLVLFALLAITLVCYWPGLSNRFVNFDDPQYVSENSHVTAGLTWQGIIWAFRSGYAANWHPLTWISHMVDCQLFGLNPAGHHLVNILFHAANSLLLFALLYHLTSAFGRSAVVGVLFATHPLHVESVAWISERKDVLSCFFFLLTLLAYVRYTRRQSLATYALTLLLFMLALLAKPMVVTLPFVLVLLDFWPLQRNGLQRGLLMDNWIIGFTKRPKVAEPKGAAIQHSSVPSSQKMLESGKPFTLFSEKLPFFLLTLASCAITYFVQGTAGAVSSGEVLPLPVRLGNAAVSYFRYLGKIFWPVDLACLYPYNEHLSLLLVSGCVLLLGAVTLCVIHFACRAPFLTTGWLWFVGTLVPVIGIIQVGSQAMADRYMYIPSIGLLFGLVWGIHALVRKLGFAQTLRWPAVATCCALLAALMFVDRAQVSYWHDSEALFSHAIQATGGNYYSYYGLGGALYDAGEKAEALKAYSESVRLNSGFGDAQVNLGKCLLDLGRTNQAELHLARAVALKPKDPECHYGYGTLLLKKSDTTGATKEFSEALELKPNFSEAHMNLGVCLVQQGDLTNGANHFYAAVQIAPTNVVAHANLGLALLQLGYPSKAAECFTAALRLKPDAPETRYELAVALDRANDPDRAAAEARQARASAMDAGQPEIAKRAEELLNSLASKTAVHASL